jgi:predicted 3-demethylubiquinone-9 3-methyltransferase (glyoxalase superfamily)
MNNKIYPCIWFDDKAQEAAEFYCSVFNDAKILESNPIVTRFEALGTTVMLLNGGPMYKVNSSISFYVYCNNEVEVNRLYDLMREGGSIVMPLDKYKWSEKYAWIIDKYGTNWQLDISTINSPQKIVPTMLFANEKMTLVKECLDHYKDVFVNSSILIESPYPPGTGVPEETLLFAQFKLNGYILNAMSSTIKHDFDFNPGISFVIECDDQEEIDRYWYRLGQDGKYEMCGWLSDKFGISWQIVPSILSELMNDPARGQRVINAFLQMQKFDIQTLLKD